MKEFHCIVSENGRVAIPSTIRKELNINSGDEVIISLNENKEIIMHTTKQSLKKLQEIFKSKGKENLVDELISMRRKEDI